MSTIMGGELCVVYNKDNDINKVFMANQRQDKHHNLERDFAEFIAGLRDKMATYRVTQTLTSLPKKCYLDVYQAGCDWVMSQVTRKWL